MTLNVAESKKCNKCSKKKNKQKNNRQTKNPPKNQKHKFRYSNISTKTVRKLIQICTVIIHVNNQ